MLRIASCAALLPKAKEASPLPKLHGPTGEGAIIEPNKVHEEIKWSSPLRELADSMLDCEY